MLRLLSYPRGIVVSLYAGIHTLVMSAGTLLLMATGFTRGQTNRFIQYGWARVILFLSGVSVELRGRENMLVDSGGLVLFNHTSHVDILALYGYLPRPVCFGAKIELFKVPFFGRAMTAMGALPIDRRLREKVLQLYQAAIPRVAAGDLFALAPEGTRQFEPKLGRFKFGPFLFAIQAQMKLIPVVIAGAYDVLPKDSLWLNQGAWRRKIILEILPPTDTVGLTDGDIDPLQEKIHLQMEKVFERLKGELTRPNH